MTFDLAMTAMDTLEQRRILVYPVTKCLNGHHDRYHGTKARYQKNFTFRDTIYKLIYNLYTILEHPRGYKTVLLEIKARVKMASVRAWAMKYDSDTTLGPS